MSAAPPPASLHDDPDRSDILPSGPPASYTAPPHSRGPAPERLAAILARAWLEIRLGRRPIAQLLPLVAPAVRRRLVAQLPPLTERRPSAAARVRRVVAHHPAPDACEATVLVEQQDRVTALAIRLERHRGAWRVVELTAPEAGLAPLTTSSLYSRPDPDDDAALAPPLTG